MSESDIQARALRASSLFPNVRLFRNHVGEGWMGKVVRHEGTRVLLDGARYATFGLATGSADLIGFEAVTIGAEHVGRTLAVFVSGEVKQAKGKLREAQENWAAMCGRFGVRHGIVRSDDDMRALLGGV